MIFLTEYTGISSITPALALLTTGDSKQLKRITILHQKQHSKIMLYNGFLYPTLYLATTTILNLGTSLQKMWEMCFTVEPLINKDMQLL